MISINNLYHVVSNNIKTNNVNDIINNELKFYSSNRLVNNPINDPLGVTFYNILVQVIVGNYIMHVYVRLQLVQHKHKIQQLHIENKRTRIDRPNHPIR